VNSANILGGTVVSLSVSERPGRLLALVASLVVALAACGGSSDPVETATGSGTDSPAVGSADDGDTGAVSAEEAAESNLALIQPADDARDQEVLDVRDGSVATLRDAVDGDRPVLIWFWAPH